MKRKTVWLICGVVVLLALLLLYMFLRNQPRNQPEAEYFTKQTESVSSSEADYVSPVDFEALWAENADIYAWLTIPDTEISYPLLQHPDDDSFYLRRNMNGAHDVNGSLFTESSYNGKDFSDPLTIVYGHNMKDGQMFGTLQNSFSSKENLEEHSEIVVYLPERELHYTVFAAVPYDSRHILYNYDFTNARTFRLFFQELLSVRELQAVFADDAAVSNGDKVMILSTCLMGDRSNRFLVCGKLNQTIPAV